MNRKFLEACMAVALFSLVGYTVWAQNDTVPTIPTDASDQFLMQDDIQSRLKALRARLELVRQRVKKCGNNIMESWEQCDDGNRIDGDGCSKTCRVEEESRVSMTQTTTCPSGSEIGPNGSCLPPKFIMLNIKVFLQGAYNASQGLMSDALRAAGHIPLTGPLLDDLQELPILLDSSKLQVVGSSAIVDWVIVDLRMLAIPTTSIDTIGVPISSIVKSVPALLLRNGQIVGVDGQPLKIQAAHGAYFVSVRHRNHLGVMTAQSEYLSSSPISLDFTNGSTVAYGKNAQKNLNGTYMLWAGDANGDGKVSYQGTNNDADAILNVVGASAPNNTVAGYYGADVNMNGQVKYNGSANDRNVVLSTVGLATPAAVVTAQIP